MNWIKTSERQPAPRQRVYVVVVDEYGNKYQTMAEFIPEKTVLFVDYCNDEYCDSSGDYDEEMDCFWTPAGYYEWQHESEINFLISGQVTDWMPLFQLPQ